MKISMAVAFALAAAWRPALAAEVAPIGPIGGAHPAAAMPLSPAALNASLFEGELSIKDDGLYTKAHYYLHPQTGRQAIVVGMNHVGDPGYYAKVAEILAPAQAVIHENPPRPAQWSQEQEAAAGEAAKQSYQAAMSVYFQRALSVLKLPAEWAAFDYQRPGWSSADDYYNQKSAADPEAEEARYSEAAKLFSAIPPARQQAIIAHVQAKLAKMDAGLYTSRDLGETMAFLWSDPQLVAAVQSVVGHPRNQAALELLDEVVERDAPKMVALKFGAAHTADLRRLLEKRGYVHQRSIELQDIKY